MRHSIDLGDVFQHMDATDRHCQQLVSGHDVVLVIGNTGAGKGTFVNYLAGRSLSEEKRALTHVVKVENPVVAVGHYTRSKTSRPAIYYDSRTSLTYCDCPGFLDTRGPESDITNGYAIKSIVDHARCVKAIVVLVNYHSIIKERGSSLRETVLNLEQLLGGSPEDIRRFHDSIHIVVSHAYSNPDVNLERLRQMIRRENSPALNQLIDHVYFYDPLDRDDSIARNALTRTSLLVRINTSESIEGTDAFGCAVGVDSSNALQAFMYQSLECIRTAFDAKNFSQVNQIVEGLNRLLILDYDFVRQSILEVTAVILGIVKGLESNDEAISILESIRTEMPFCQDAAQASITVIQTRLEAQQAIESAREAAVQGRQDAKCETQAAQLSQQNAQQAIASAEQAKRSAQDLSKVYTRLLDQLQQDIAEERARGPRVIDGGTFHHGKRRRGFKAVLGGLLTGTLTGLTTGNPMLGFTTGLRSTSQRLFGGSASCAIPLPSIYYKSHNVNISHQGAPETAKPSVATDVYSGAVAGAVRGGISGAFTGALRGSVGGPGGILAGVATGAGIGAVAGAVGGGVGGTVKKNLNQSRR